MSNGHPFEPGHGKAVQLELAEIPGDSLSLQTAAGRGAGQTYQGSAARVHGLNPFLTLTPRGEIANLLLRLCMCRQRNPTEDFQVTGFTVTIKTTPNKAAGFVQLRRQAAETDEGGPDGRLHSDDEAVPNRYKPF